MRQTEPTPQESNDAQWGNRGAACRRAELQRLDSKPEVKKGRAQRALRLLQGDVVHKEGENSGSHGVKLETVFEAFCREHPAWGGASQSFVFFRDHAKVKALSDAAREQLKVTRIQPSGGLCYMHAPAVVQHNLVTLHSGGEHHEMLNVAKYIVKFFSANMIFAHVVEHTGASSETFLENIMGLQAGDNPSLRDLRRAMRPVSRRLSRPPASALLRGSRLSLPSRARKSRSRPTHCGMRRSASTR